MSDVTLELIPLNVLEEFALFDDYRTFFEKQKHTHFQKHQFEDALTELQSYIYAKSKEKNDEQSKKIVNTYFSKQSYDSMEEAINDEAFRKIVLDKELYDEFLKDKYLMGKTQEEAIEMIRSCFCDYTHQGKLNAKTLSSYFSFFDFSDLKSYQMLNNQRIYEVLKSDYNNCGKEMYKWFSMYYFYQLLDKTGYENISFVFDNEKKTSKAYIRDEANTIFVTKNLFLEFGEEQIYSIVEAINHEFCHIRQFQDQQMQKNVDRDQLLLAKLRLLRKNDKSFYDENYESLTYELEALVLGVQKALEFMIQEIGLPSYAETSLNHKEKVRQIKERKDNSKLRTGLADTNKSARYNLENSVTKLLLEKPELMAEYPILNYEFFENGKRKPLQQLFKESLQAIPTTNNPGEIQKLYAELYLNSIMTKVGIDIKVLNMTPSLLQRKEFAFITVHSLQKTIVNGITI